MRKKGDMIKDEDRVYNFIVDYTTNHLYPPTVDEIRIEARLNSTSTAYLILQRLEKRNLIKVTRGTPRGIKLQEYEIVKIKEEE